MLRESRIVKYRLWEAISRCQSNHIDGDTHKDESENHPQNDQQWVTETGRIRGGQIKHAPDQNGVTDN